MNAATRATASGCNGCRCRADGIDRLIDGLRVACIVGLVVGLVDRLVGGATGRDRIEEAAGRSAPVR